MSARLGKQLQIITPNKVGMLAEVTNTIADTGANINTICAYGMDKKAFFLVITSDNVKAAKALKAKKLKVKEESVVLVDLDNRVGAAGDMGNKLRDAKVDINYMYGTTCSCGGPAMLVFKSNKNAKAVEALA